jgi:hypothetical protein
MAKKDAKKKESKEKDHLEIGDVFTSQYLVHGTYFPKRGKNQPAPFDSPRGTARFVVEHAYLTGGGSDGRGGDVAHEWFIIARRLDRDNEYNPRGEVASFYHQNRCEVIPMTEIDIVGKMSMRFVNFRSV